MRFLRFGSRAAARTVRFLTSSGEICRHTIGWQHGIIQRRVFDGRTKCSGLQCNFYVWYEVDDEEEPTALRLEEYDGDDDCAWVLLEAVADGA